MNEHVLVTKNDRVTTIRISRPEKKNAITQSMYAVMARAINEYSTDEVSRALLITGSGDMFTAGNDLSDFSKGSSENGDPPVTQFLLAIKNCPKPIIAAVNGGAIGIGLTMLLHCDLVYASEDATFSAPFVGLGLVPEAASSKLLPEAVGKAIANDIFFTGRKLNANEALSFGLVARVFPADKLASESNKIAVQVASLAPTALKKSKALVRFDSDAVDEHMKMESIQFREQLSSSEFSESVSAMVQKRTPIFEP